MPPAYTAAHSEERAPFHNSSSSTNSVLTLHRASSFSPAKSKTRGQPHPQPQPSLPPPEYNGFDFSDARPMTSADVRRPPSSDDMEGVNRWSRSTSSSRDRRMSFGGSGAFTFGSPENKHPAKRLQKSRPSISHSPGRSAETSRSRAPSSTTILPPIISLPALQTSSLANNTSSPLTGSPSTAGLLSAAVRSAAPDYFASWDSTSQGRSSSRPRAANSNSNNSMLPSSESGSASPSRRQRSSERGDTRKSRGHSRNRSQNGKSSGSSRNSKQPSQKAMLSKALQKANTAVLLDNAQNFDGAMDAYSEACSLLQQVMLRSTGDDDKKKLEAIRNTYTSRISELGKIAPHLRVDDKALPARPGSETYTSDEALAGNDDDEEAAVIETATVTRILNDDSFLVPEYQRNRLIPPSQVPKRRESLLPSALDTIHHRPRATQDQYTGRTFSTSPVLTRAPNLGLAPPMESQYMPPPLSPWRPPVPMTHGPPSNAIENRPHAGLANSNVPSTTQQLGRVRAPSNESMSWLDFIDESDASSSSSVHSRTSSMGVRRKRIRAASGATEAEFDAALDAAVEAAYDDGFEPMEEAPEPDPYDYDNDDEIVANVRRKVELAKERVRQTEREAAIQDARDREKKRLIQREQEQQTAHDDEYNGNDSEEEERMLEEMTRGYVMDEFEFGLQSKSALPRESDSSGFSGRTWNSSIGSNPTTTGTSLSTVTESITMAQVLTSQSKTPPPTQSLPPPPSRAVQLPMSPTSQGVRSRRLSGQNAKQLKIETAKLQNAQLAQPPSMPPPRIPADMSPAQSKSSSVPMQLRPGGGSRPPIPLSARTPSSPFPGRSPSEAITSPTNALTRTDTNGSDTNGQVPRSGSPGRTQSRSGLRKNFSSSSLKNLKNRTLSVSNADDGSEMSPNTPLSSQYGRDGLDKVPAIPALPTPIATSFGQKAMGVPSGGLYLFNNDINDIISPDSPTAPDPLNPSAPIPLEPCPTEFLLRPFWLMRALYQTIAHPKGGYLSTKLFIPRDVWRVKGVKLKNIEDKIANCDFLTAALLKLAQVDTFDADAVLEEMQSLEGVLEQVQTILAKKLGNEVGVQGAGGMFKDAPTGGDAASSTITKSSSTGKSSSFSWRRLKSKNSGVNLSNSYNKPPSSDGPKEGAGLTMGTLPMTTTALSKVRFTKRDVGSVQFTGPNAHYMGALARLFDAAQTLDQIARQVEDPGLRHTDKTQVGLELCTRHAAEFFGFYICRFVLSDITMLLDKFIKRGSEWVLV